MDIGGNVVTSGTAATKLDIGALRRAVETLKRIGDPPCGDRFEAGRASWMLLQMQAKRSYEAAYKTPLTEPAVTFLGFPIREDAGVPPDEIRLMDGDKVLAVHKIKMPEEWA